MPIIFNESNQTFHLQAKETSYIMELVHDNYLGHLYWGRKLQKASQNLLLGGRPFTPTPIPEDEEITFDVMPQEYPSYGRSDYSHPSLHIQYENGSTISDFKYEQHRIYQGKPKLDGLPATYVERDEEASTLEITFVDQLTKLKVLLTYTVFEELNAITRSAKLINEGDQTAKILQALSASLDFQGDQFEMINLHGYWAKERHVQRRALATGTQAIESRRGASSHQQNPFICLVDKNADEDQGNVYALNLVYSGNFIAQAEVDQFKRTRLSIGINPFDFSWSLEPGASFQTPEAVLVYSAQGLGEMSRTYHSLYRTRLSRGTHRDQERPILINNWEATYFDFNADKIEDIVRVGEQVGLELFVLDDGWFGKRNNDKTSLGDWFVNKEKLPGGLEDVVQRVHKHHLSFGLWFEPEMISAESELYQKHPDWCLHVPGRSRTESRNQLILDFSREDVCQAILEMVDNILKSVPIHYVKWDMNRHMTEIGSALLPAARQRETAHRYMLGLYQVLEQLTSKHPSILFESCSGGGGRFDPGMLYYMPQTWTSDNTDAVERLKIQYGTSMVYPIISMGAHVSSVPNHQVGRSTPISFRGHVAMSGNLGYELDLSKMSEEDKQVMREQIEVYKEIRPIIQFGDFYRLKSPFEGQETAWMFVSEDKQEAVLFYYQVLATPNAPYVHLQLKGLEPEQSYLLIDEGVQLGGDELMYQGLTFKSLYGDFSSKMWRLKRIEE